MSITYSASVNTINHSLTGTLANSEDPDEMAHGAIMRHFISVCKTKSIFIERNAVFFSRKL